MHVWDEEEDIDIVEFKHSNLFIPRERVLGLSNAGAQVIRGLHFLAASKRSLKLRCMSNM